MPQTPLKARVSSNGPTQQVTIPAEFRFSTDEVYIQRDQTTGTVTLSEIAPETKPRPTMAEVFARLDEAGLADFVIERDLSLPIDRDLL